MYYLRFILLFIFPSAWQIGFAEPAPAQHNSSKLGSAFAYPQVLASPNLLPLSITQASLVLPSLTRRFLHLNHSPENCLMRCSSASWQMRSVSLFSATMQLCSPCTTTFFSPIVCTMQLVVS